MAESSGILTNTPNIYDATLNKTIDAQLLYDDKYQNGNAITCSMPNKTIFDTGIIKAGTFAGTYAIGFFYDSTTATVQGTPLMRVEIYEDGVLMPEDVSNLRAYTIHEYDLNYVKYAWKYGSSIFRKLKANSTYQIIVKTAIEIMDDAILDYITFERLSNTTSLFAPSRVPKVGRRDVGDTTDIEAKGSQMVTEFAGISWDTLSLDPGATTTVGQGYVTNFKQIKGVYPSITGTGAKILCEWDGVERLNDYYVTITIRNVSSSSLSVTNKAMTSMIVGYI